MRSIVIIGTSEIASMAYEYFTRDSDRTIAGFAVEPAFLNRTAFHDLPVVSLSELENKFPPLEYDAFVAIGDTQLNRVRARLAKDVKERGYTLASYVSSHAFVWEGVLIGENAFVLENNVLQAFVSIGDNVTLWSGNHIGHRTVVEDNVFVSSHVVISGFCRIGRNSFIGVNAAIGNNVEIGADNYIAMSTSISQSTEADTIWQGNPAEARKISATRFCRVKS